MRPNCSGRRGRDPIAMRNIQIIDGAKNFVYDIFAGTDEEFALFFPSGTDIAFIDEVYERGAARVLDAAFNEIWKRRIRKVDVQGIHGIIFWEHDEKKVYYPTRRERTLSILVVPGCGDVKTPERQFIDL